jgi:transposase
LIRPRHRERRTGMEQHAGIDVSLKLSSVCIIDASGKIVRETKVASEPEALVGFFKGLGLSIGFQT